MKVIGGTRPCCFFVFLRFRLVNHRLFYLSGSLHKESKSDRHRKRKEEGLLESDDNKKKKARTTFTGRQIFELERQFEQKKYLSSSERAEMASLLDVTETQVSLTIHRSFIVNPKIHGSCYCQFQNKLIFYCPSENYCIKCITIHFIVSLTIHGS